MNGSCQTNPCLLFPYFDQEPLFCWRWEVSSSLRLSKRCTVFVLSVGLVAFQSLFMLESPRGMGFIFNFHRENMESDFLRSNMPQFRNKRVKMRQMDAEDATSHCQQSQGAAWGSVSAPALPVYATETRMSCLAIESGDEILSHLFSISLKGVLIFQFLMTFFFFVL